jgi:PTH1 family peptidyl-tRNA hydrolase
MIRRSAPRQGDMERILIVGLGNPGKKYARTRHNVGTDAIEILAKRLHASLKVGRDRAQIAECRLANQPVVIAVPTTWMNDSSSCTTS